MTRYEVKISRPMFATASSVFGVLCFISSKFTQGEWHSWRLLVVLFDIAVGQAGLVMVGSPRRFLRKFAFVLTLTAYTSLSFLFGLLGVPEQFLNHERAARVMITFILFDLWILAVFLCESFRPSPFEQIFKR